MRARAPVGARAFESDFPASASLGCLIEGDFAGILVLWEGKERLVAGWRGRSRKGSFVGGRALLVLQAEALQPY